MSFIEYILRLLGLYHPATTTTTTPLNIDPPIIGGNVKKAFCFSINDYPGIQNDLKGCNNDSKNWADLLKNSYGFSVNRIIDSAVTRSTVINTMTDLIVNSKEGDILVFTYSGHGTSIIDNSYDEINGKDEAICLYDDLLIDDDIRDIFNKLPKGVRLTFISDSCFSGTVSRSFLNVMNDFTFISIPKYLPPKDDMEAIRTNSLPSLKAFAYPEEGMNHILISGTDDKSYSYDAEIDGEPAGAFSYYAIQVLKNNPHITYKDFYNKIREILPSDRYLQSPQVEGSEANKNSLMFE